MNNSGQRLKERLKEIGMTQAQFGRRTGATSQNITNWLNRGVPAKHHLMVSKVIGVDFEWFSTGKGSMLPDAEAGTLSGNVVTLTHKDGKPATIRKIPVVSTTTGGKWAEVVDNFEPGYAEDWVLAPDSVSDKSFALVICGESMQPTIPDGATIIIDPTIQHKHNDVVVVRQNGNSEATCKRLIYDGGVPFLRPDNQGYGSPELLDDAVVCGVVKQVVMNL